MDKNLGERKLVFKPSDGSPAQTVVARFGHPEPGSDGTWCVDVQVEQDGKSDIADRAHGLDQAQALLHAFLVLDAHLEAMTSRGSIELSDGNEHVEQEATEETEAWRFVSRVALDNVSKFSNELMLANVDVLGERELTLKRKDGIEEKVIVRLGHPYLSRGYWRASCEIVGPKGAVQRRSGSGEDSIQALTNLLYLVPILLESIAEEGEFHTQEGATGHWFPRIALEKQPDKAAK
ncbi:hypothetical protein WME99_08340 [Sorangium sp. So ce136]|uniref:DUF6968 family protein n=1 Tax=Sorangium sp. So ce136 TaxID=3133284 RepID=UPI003EFC6AF4